MALTDKLSAIADAIRSKTGKTGQLTLAQMPGEIASITGGGGGGANPDANDPVYYVTFMNGDQKLYVRPVVRGENCTDVVANNIIPTPTKESDVQYNYTFYGWGASDGGGADANILKNITEDKTVYAIFTSTLRKYTITYLDDDGTTVLKTETLAYGVVPSYTHSVAGYKTSWKPEITSVTGDASYTLVLTAYDGEPLGDYCAWSLKDGVLTIDGWGATPDYTFSNYTTDIPWYSERSLIKSAVIGDGVTNIGAYLFMDCTALTQVENADSVTSIGERAFRNCAALTSINIPNGVTSFGPGAFYGCKALTSINIPYGVTVIPTSTFDSCEALTDVTIPNSVTRIETWAFLNVGLTSVTIPSSVTFIGKYQFSTSLLQSVIFEDTSGWYVSTSADATSGTNLTLTDTAKNATYFKSTYRQYCWFKT